MSDLPTVTGEFEEELSLVERLVTDEDLAYEVTLAFFDDDTICLRYRINHAQLSEIKISPVFQRACSDAAKSITDDGEQFRITAQKYAKKVLDELNEIANNKVTVEGEMSGRVHLEISTNQRMKASELICRYAGYDNQGTQALAESMRIVLQTNLGLNPLTNDGTYTIEASPEPTLDELL